MYKLIYVPLSKLFDIIIFYIVEILLIALLAYVYVKFEDSQNLILFITAIFILFQSKYSSRGYHNGNDVAKRKLAIELSEYYRTEILNSLSYISFVYEAARISNDINKIKHESLVHFTNDELNSLYGENLINKILDAMDIINLTSILEDSVSFKSLPYDMQHFFIMNHRNDYEKHIKELEAKLKKEKIKAEEISIYKQIESARNNHNKIIYCKKVLDSEYRSMLHDVANKLEYFSMHFNNGIADGIVIYQSIHQTYLAAVKMVYPIIAKSNENAHNSYYNNIKELYTEWSKISCESAKKEAKQRQSSITRRKPIKNRP